MPNLDLDEFVATLLQQRYIDLFGRRWHVVSDLTMIDTLRLQTMTGAEPDAQAFIWHVFGVVFGEETAAAWQVDPRFTNSHAGALIAWIQFNYDDAMLRAATQVGATAGNPPPADGLTSADTGTSLSPISGASTGSASPSPAT